MIDGYLKRRSYLGALQVTWSHKVHCHWRVGGVCVCGGGVYIAVSRRYPGSLSSLCDESLSHCGSPLERAWFCKGLGARPLNKRENAYPRIRGCVPRIVRYRGTAQPVLSHSQLQCVRTMRHMPVLLTVSSALSTCAQGIQKLVSPK